MIMIKLIILLLYCQTQYSSGQPENSAVKRQMCRTSNDVFLNVDRFSSFACGQCFFYTFLQTSKQYKHNYIMNKCLEGVLICPKNDQQNNLALDHSKNGDNNNSSTLEQLNSCNCRSKKHVYNLLEYNNQSNSLENLVMEPSLPKNFVKLTRDCCKAAELCCSEMINNDFSVNSSTLSCPMTWDGWQCWKPANAHTKSRGTCPYYLYNLPSISTTPDPHTYYSIKECTEQGQWWKINYSNIEWTDYRKCATAKFYEESLKHFLSISAFALSVLAIIPALIIFSVYRSLRVDRITIHKHLLLSLLLTGIFYIFNNVFFIADDAFGASLLESNHVLCRFAFLIQLRYFRTSNYMWMLCEGFYLYKLLLIDAFSSESGSLIIYYLLGWAFPAVPTIIYAVLRTSMDDEKCWLGSNISWIEWVTYGPCIASLALNFLLMISIIRVLITKLTHSPANEPAQYRKAVRATLVLLPLFGCHFFLTIYKFEHLLWYEILNKLLDGFQGLLVATIICFTHGEVLELLRKSWTNRTERRRLAKESRQRHIKMQHESSGRCLL